MKITGPVLPFQQSREDDHAEDEGCNNLRYIGSSPRVRRKLDIKVFEV